MSGFADSERVAAGFTAGSTLDIELAGQPLRLLADRALLWPARRRLYLADLHLGKGDVFRAAGIALPTGGTAHDLGRLSRLIEATAAKSVWILGDLLHGAAIDGWLPQWSRFRSHHAGVGFTLVAGNHDRALLRAGPERTGVEKTRLDIDHVGDGAFDGPFELAHAPRDDRAEGDAHIGSSTTPFRLCGHLHPVVRVDGFRGRFPAFVRIGRQLVLPAFSMFTGGWHVTRAEQAWGCIGDQMVDLGSYGAEARRIGRRSGARR